VCERGFFPKPPAQQMGIYVGGPRRGTLVMGMWGIGLTVFCGDLEGCFCREASAEWGGMWFWGRSEEEL